MFRYLVPVILLAGLAACEDPSPNALPKGWQLDWQAMPDGSSFARSYDAGHGNEAAIRCWPKHGGGGYACLKAGRAGEALGALTVVRSEEVELPDIMLPIVSESNGYSCGSILGEYERISRGDALISNRLQTGAGRWSRSYVGRFMRDNGVKDGTAFFPCLEVLDAVLGGSLETLGSTVVTRKMAGA